MQMVAFVKEYQRVLLGQMGALLFPGRGLFSDRSELRLSNLSGLAGCD